MFVAVPHGQQQIRSETIAHLAESVLLGHRHSGDMARVTLPSALFCLFQSASPPVHFRLRALTPGQTPSLASLLLQLLLLAAAAAADLRHSSSLHPFCHKKLRPQTNHRPLAAPTFRTWPLALSLRPSASSSVGTIDGFHKISTYLRIILRRCRTSVPR